MGSMSISLYIMLYVCCMMCSLASLDVVCDELDDCAWYLGL